MKHVKTLFLALLALLTACTSQPVSSTPAPVYTETPLPLGEVRVSTLAPPASNTPFPITNTPVPPTVTPVPSRTPGCTLQATFIADVTIPDGSSIAPNRQFVKTWRIKNSGTCDWGSGFAAVFVEGNQLGGPRTVSVPPTDASHSLDLSITLKAPAEPGAYKGKWQLRSPGGSVLTGLTVSIAIVATPTPTGPPTATPKPTPVPTFAGTIDSFVGLWWTTSEESQDAERIQQIQIRKSGNHLEASPATSYGSQYAFGLTGFARANYDGGRKLKIEFDDSALGHVTIEMAINKACNADVRLTYAGFRRGYVFWNRQPLESAPCT